LKYSVGFEGYLDNLLGVYDNYSNCIVNFATYTTESKCEFKKQYYPPLLHESPVKNNCSLDKNMIISAPNKSGKTTILKTTTINIIFSQQTGAGFYESAELLPYTHIHSYLNIPDTSGRDSLFQAESRRCKEIIDIIHQNNDPSKHRHFCIFDELYSGTNPDEATKAGYAFLKYLSNYNNVNFILTTHYITICKKLKTCPNIQTYKMDVNVLENGEFIYTYKIKKGISKIKGGVRVLKDMNYPKEIIDSIEKY
jgi:DNA mismatch repair ATPase MutS